MNTDAQLFLNALASRRGRKADLADYEELFKMVVPAVLNEDDWGLGRLVAAINDLAQAEHIILPVGKQHYVFRPPVKLPLWIRLKQADAGPAVPEPEWHHKLIPMIRNKSQPEKDQLRIIDAYLKSTRGQDRSLIPVNSRSLHLFGDEKTLQRMVRDKTRQTLSESLSLADLHCYIPYETFLVHEVEPQSVSQDALIIENKQSYHIFKERNRLDKRYRVIILGSGNNITSAVPALVDICSTYEVNQNWYFGDLDIPGFDFPYRVNMQLGSTHPELKVKAAALLYRECLTRGKPQVASYKKGYDALGLWTKAIRNFTADWLFDQGLFEEVNQLLSSGHRMAQEWVY